MYQLRGRAGKGRHCETLLKCTTFRQRKPADILESQDIEKAGSASPQNIESVKQKKKKKRERLEQGARELNYLLPLEWADVIIIISPGLRWRARGRRRNLCRYVGVAVVSTL